MSFAALQRRIDELRNPAVVGLDPTDAIIPPHIMDAAIGEYGETLEAAASALFEFNRQIIDAVCGIVPAVKPQIAFYERYGVPGIEAFRKTAEYARSCGLYVIADAKRGDIGSTAEAYSAAFLGATRVGSREISPFHCDALTVNGYLGSDGLLPFIKDAAARDKAIFVLVKTSNPSSGELQDRLTDGKTVYRVMGDLTAELANGEYDEYGYSRVGAVIGATYPLELGEMRSALPHTFFLVPGYGAQGGAAGDVKPAFDGNRHGAVINSSRAIIAAWKQSGDGQDCAAAARDAADAMRDELRRALEL